METLSLRRNPLKGFESEQDLDLEHKVESVKDEAVEKALREYEKLNFKDVDDPRVEPEKIEIVALNPQQIDVLLQKIIQTTSREKTNSRITGEYISRLIQESYKNGNREFTLTTKDTTIERLCCGLTPQEKLRINIQGNTGNQFGKDSQNCTYTINGNTENDLGTVSQNCTYTLHGKIGENSGREAEYCTFRTTVEETYQKLCSNVDKDKGNRIQLIDKDGNILLEVKLC